MKALLLGAGMQGKAALYDLALGKAFDEVVVADRDAAGLEALVQSMGCAAEVECMTVDVEREGELHRALGCQPDVVIDLLPSRYVESVARAAVAHGAHLVSTAFVRPGLRALASQAEQRGVAILPELGLDPGIDLVLLGEAVRSLDEVETIACYGAGVPEPSAAHPPLRYKVSWTFEGVLRSYLRVARGVRDGRVETMDWPELFEQDTLHHVELPQLGTFEACPNGDVLPFLKTLGLDPSTLRSAFRFTMRYPGHAALWKTLVDLGVFGDDAIAFAGLSIPKTQWLAAVLEPRLQYAADERDLAIVRVEVMGRKDGQPAQRIYQLVDRRDLGTGLSAMSRTVGFTACVGAEFLTHGTIAKRGLLSPLCDVPLEPFARALRSRGIAIGQLAPESRSR